MGDKQNDLYSAKYYKTCEDENDEFSHNHCDGLPLTRAARICEADPQCAAFSFEDAGDYQGQPDPNLDYALAGYSVHFMSVTKADEYRQLGAKMFKFGPSTHEMEEAVSIEVENDAVRCFTYMKPEHEVLVADILARSGNGGGVRSSSALR